MLSAVKVSLARPGGTGIAGLHNFPGVSERPERKRRKMEPVNGEATLQVMNGNPWTNIPFLECLNARRKNDAVLSEEFGHSHRRREFSSLEII